MHNITKKMNNFILVINQINTNNSKTQITRKTSWLHLKIIWYYKILIIYKININKMSRLSNSKINKKIKILFLNKINKKFKKMIMHHQLIILWQIILQMNHLIMVHLCLNGKISLTNNIVSQIKIYIWIYNNSQQMNIR